MTLFFSTYRHWLLFLLWAVVSFKASAANFLEPAQAFKGKAHVVDAHALELRLVAAPGYYLYREKMAVALEQPATAQLSAVNIPAGQIKFDETFQKNVETLRDTVLIPVPVAQASGPFKLRIIYQGCADQGLCYPPQSALVSVQVGASGALEKADWQDEDASSAALKALAATESAAVAAPTATPAAEASRITAALQSGQFFSVVAVFWVAGVLLSFTPCVLPMVPILSSIIVGQGATNVSRGRGFALALTYSLGMALVYTAFGLAAGLLGEGLAAALQNPWVLGAFALLLATLALSMFGAFELRLPSALQNWVNTQSGRLTGGKLLGVFLMGGVSALIVSPCVAAPLAGALVFISQSKNAFLGGVALFSLSLGMSVPLLLVGASAGALLPRAGAWMNGVKTFFGVLLLGVAVWLVAPVLPGWAVMCLTGALMLIGAVYLKLLDALAPHASGWQRLGKGLSLVLAVVGSVQLVGALSGGNNPLQPLQHWAGGRSNTAATALPFQRIRTLAELDAALQTARRPVMLDFYADWCVACKEMEHRTFSDAAIRTRLGAALLLQVDVTANSANDKALLQRFGLFGPPGILFFNATGQELPAARVIGFVPPVQFGAALAAAGL
jgi:thioredoxin:protein disulfide reductase